VEDNAVGGEAAALPGLRVLEAEEQRRNQRHEEVDRSEHEPDQSGRGDPRLLRLHLAHRDARRWSGMEKTIIAARTTNIPSASAWPSCGFERTFPEMSLPIRIGTSGSPVPLVSEYAVA